jgi:hypothetical protein
MLQLLQDRPHLSPLLKRVHGGTGRAPISGHCHLLPNQDARLLSLDSFKPRPLLNLQPLELRSLRQISCQIQFLTLGGSSGIYRPPETLFIRAEY